MLLREALSWRKALLTPESCPVVGESTGVHDSAVVFPNKAYQQAQEYVFFEKANTKDWYCGVGGQLIDATGKIQLHQYSGVGVGLPAHFQSGIRTILKV